MRNRELVLFLLLVFGFGTAAQARLTEGWEDSYRRIGASNVFRLKSHPRKELPRPALPRFTLLGITTLTGYKLALLRMQMPAIPPEPAREESLMLTVGQRDGELQMLDIDEKAGAVKVRIFGTDEVLRFEKDGLRLPNAPRRQPASHP